MPDLIRARPDTWSESAEEQLRAENARLRQENERLRRTILALSGDILEFIIKGEEMLAEDFEREKT